MAGNQRQRWAHEMANRLSEVSDFLIHAEHELWRQCRVAALPASVPACQRWVGRMGFPPSGFRPTVVGLSVGA